MENKLYTKENSAYLERTKTWHSEDSPWKARQIYKMIRRQHLEVKNIVEVGCGAGEILVQLDSLMDDNSVNYTGYEIAVDAYKMAEINSKDNINYIHGPFAQVEKKAVDLLLMIDVFEHVDDYISFIRSFNDKSTYKIYHIPLEITVSSALRNSMNRSRASVGHLHFFMKDTALDSIRHAGQEVVDYFYTPGAIETSNKGLKTKLANVARRVLFATNQDLAVRLLGGYSLLVLAK